jgi:hypothetical protein
MLITLPRRVTKSDGKTEVKAILRLVAHVPSKISQLGWGPALIRRSRLQVRVSMSVYIFNVHVALARILIKIVHLFNVLFQNFHVELIPKATRNGYRICRLWYSKGNA